MTNKLPTGYGLDVIRALYRHHPKGLSLKELHHHTQANNIPGAIRGLRDNHGFRGCLLTEIVKRKDAPNFGRYVLTDKGMEKARMILTQLEEGEVAA